jgi:hypothetical protein
MKNLFQPNVDTSVVDNLVSGTLIPSKLVEVRVGGTGIVKRGTLLSSEDGVTYTADAENPQCVLWLDANADDEHESVSPAAFGGEFNQNYIEEVMDVELTPATILEARMGPSLFIAPMNPAPEVF